MSTHGDRKIHAWMDGIAKEIPSVYVINVNAIGVEPCRGPRVNQGEPKTAVLKTSRLAGEIGAAHVKRVATTKTGTEAVVRNPPMACRGLSRSACCCRAGLVCCCARCCAGRLRLLLCLTRCCGWPFACSRVVRVAAVGLVSLWLRLSCCNCNGCACCCARCCMRGGLRLLLRRPSLLLASALVASPVRVAPVRKQEQ